MPIYEYRCLKCNNEFEQMQKFSDAPISKCPKCGGQVKKLVSHSSFHLKGSGWYLTDYAKKNSPPESGGEHKEAKAETSTPSPEAVKAASAISAAAGSDKD